MRVSASQEKHDGDIGAAAGGGSGSGRLTGTGGMQAKYVMRGRRLRGDDRQAQLGGRARRGVW